MGKRERVKLPLSVLAFPDYYIPKNLHNSFSFVHYNKIQSLRKAVEHFVMRTRHVITTYVKQCSALDFVIPNAVRMRKLRHSLSNANQNFFPFAFTFPAFSVVFK